MGVGFLADLRTCVLCCKTDESLNSARSLRKIMGCTISHIRSEGNRLLGKPPMNLLRISREAKIPAEFYHFLKAAGKPNWEKLGPLIKKIADARRQGLPHHWLICHLHCG